MTFCRCCNLCLSWISSNQILYFRNLDQGQVKAKSDFVPSSRLTFSNQKSLNARFKFSSKSFFFKEAKVKTVFTTHQIWTQNWLEFKYKTFEIKKIRNFVESKILDFWRDLNTQTARLQIESCSVWWDTLLINLSHNLWFINCWYFKCLQI